MKNTCCCCRGVLLKHLEGDRLYWFCPTCRQEMPNINQTVPLSIFTKYRDKSSASLPSLNRPN